MKRVLLLLGLVVLSVVSSYSVVISDCSSNLSVSGETYFLDSAVVGQNCNITSSNVAFNCQDNNLSNLSIMMFGSLSNISITNCNLYNSSISSDSVSDIVENSRLTNLFFDNIDLSKSLFIIQANSTLIDSIEAYRFNSVFETPTGFGSNNNLVMINSNITNIYLNNGTFIAGGGNLYNSSVENLEAINISSGIKDIDARDTIFRNLTFHLSQIGDRAFSDSGSTGGIISRNLVIEDSFFHGFATAIQIGNGAQNITIRNTFFSQNVRGIRTFLPLFQAQDIFIYNNTFYGGDYDITLTGSEDSFYIYDNIFYNSSINSISFFDVYGNVANSNIYNNYFDNISKISINDPSSFNSNFTYLGQGNTYGNDTAFSGTVCHASGVCDTNATVLTYTDFNTLIEPFLPASSTFSSVVSSSTSYLFPVFGLVNIIILLGGLFLYFI